MHLLLHTSCHVSLQDLLAAGASHQPAHETLPCSVVNFDDVIFDGSRGNW